MITAIKSCYNTNNVVFPLLRQNLYLPVQSILSKMLLVLHFWALLIP